MENQTSYTNISVSTQKILNYFLTFIRGLIDVQCSLMKKETKNHHATVPLIQIFQKERAGRGKGVKDR
jgi:hypothetical protein